MEKYASLTSLVDKLYGIEIRKISRLPGFSDRNYVVTGSRRAKEAWTPSTPQIETLSDSNETAILKDHGENQNDLQVENRCLNIYSDDRYVLKILDSKYSNKQLFIDGQDAMMFQLREKGLVCSYAIKNVNGVFSSREDLVLENETFLENRMVRLLKYVPGVPLGQKVMSPSLLRAVGQFVGSLEEALKDFNHPAFVNYTPDFGLETAHMLIKDNFHKLESRHEVIESVAKEFEETVVRNYNWLQKDGTFDVFVMDRQVKMQATVALPIYLHISAGVIHADLNKQNILVIDSDDEIPPLPDAAASTKQRTDSFSTAEMTNLHNGIMGEFSKDNLLKAACKAPNADERLGAPNTMKTLPHHQLAIIDFGNAVNSYKIFDLTVTIASCICAQPQNWKQIGGNILAGYLTKITWKKDEIFLLPICVKMRLIQIAQQVSEWYATETENNSYASNIIISYKNAFEHLSKFTSAEIFERWLDVAIKS